MQITYRQSRLITHLYACASISSQEAFEFLNSASEQKISLVTVKRDLAQLSELKIITSNGKGRATTYTLSAYGKLFFPINPSKYCSVDQDSRPGNKSFNYKLINDLMHVKEFFEPIEMNSLTQATLQFREKTKLGSDTLHKKELERFIIELSWKSSKIEGNTYTILDTERLIRDGIEAKGKTKQEAVMILNHKKAFLFVLKNKDYFNGKLTFSIIEELHSVLVQGLNIDKGIRTAPVGITGTSYVPIDNFFQIKEVIEQLIELLNSRTSQFDKSLLAQTILPYIQPFYDGNKRTSRLLANAFLVSTDCAPLSYRNVDEINYKESMLVFYELNNISAMKEIFINQYLFGAGNYNLVYE